jgi:hypothetical protein
VNAVRIALLASPLLGPAVWAPVADVLGDQGNDVTVAPSPGAASSPDEVLEVWRAALPEGPVLLVPHSNAGLYAAALVEAHDVTGLVFVDALLPGDEPTTATAEPPFREFLTGLADEQGVLPPWTRWWPDVATLFPDPRTQAAVEAEQPRLPLAYFDAVVPTPAGWESLPAAYLGFGETYADERAEAARRGWQTENLPGQHLHQLVDPVAVAESLLRLAATISTGS